MAESEFYLEVIEEVFDLLEVAEKGDPGGGSDSLGVALGTLTESEVAVLLLKPGVEAVLAWAFIADPVEPNPPTGESVVIDEGAAVDDLAVNLTLFATDDTGVTEMMIGNDAGFSGGVWEAYATAKAWNLAAGADGARTVYAKFRDASLNVSGTATDTTTYTAPVTAYFTETFDAALDTGLWEQTNPEYQTIAGGKLRINEVTNAPLSDLRLKQLIDKTVAGRIATRVVVADSSDVANPELPAICGIFESATPTGYDGAKLIWWMQLFSTATAINGARAHYVDNVGANKYWDEVGQVWTADDTKLAITGVLNTDEIEMSVEVDATNTQWRFKLENITVANTVYSPYVAFSATRDLSVGTYAVMPISDFSASFLMNGSVSEFRYEALV